ncbi:MAG TPA: 1-acyl-sn-glycerol-3-phosphate acyltransferase, partial [Pirellulales bacterium]|nr:1-acyl-sn-glycerol-3-phosphate acyltransferase [Pirellulales bacterium]
LALAVFFRRIDVMGPENLPREGGVLFVSNHLNAFVDAMLLRAVLPRPLWLTAKDTLRQNPLMRVLLRATRTITVQRREDQQGTAGNRDTVARLAALLAGGEQVAIFPEGFSHSEGRLRPFKSGAARIALQAAKSCDTVAVVPVGLVYLQKSTFRSDVVVRFGSPIGVAKLPADLRDPHVLTERFARDVTALAVPISPERSKFIHWAAELALAGGAPPMRLGQRRDNYLPRYMRMLERISSAYDRLPPQQVADVQRRMLALYDLTGGARLNVAEIYLPLTWWRIAIFVIRELEVLLVAGPIALFGYVNHVPAYFGTRAIVRRLAKDEDHVATDAIFFGFPWFALCYAAQTAAIATFLGRGAAACYAIALPYTGAVTLLFRDRTLDARRRLSSFAALISNRTRREKIQEEAQALVDDVNHLLAEVQR